MPRKTTPGLPKNARAAYRTQRKGARYRGIDWLFTFDEWWAVWRDSGKWEQRGRGRDEAYCMARLGDVGPYSVDNVEIITFLQNVRDYTAVHGEQHRKTTRRSNINRALRDARGWTLLADCPLRPYQVYCCHRYIGCFVTQAEAEAAHRTALLSEAAHV